MINWAWLIRIALDCFDQDCVYILLQRRNNVLETFGIFLTVMFKIYSNVKYEEMRLYLTSLIRLYTGQNLALLNETILDPPFLYVETIPDPP